MPMPVPVRVKKTKKTFAMLSAAMAQNLKRLSREIYSTINLFNLLVLRQIRNSLRRNIVMMRHNS